MVRVQTTTSRLLIRYLAPQRGRVALLAALLLASAMLPLAAPQVVRWFIDTAVAGGSVRTLTRIALVYLGVAVAIQVVTVVTTYVAEQVGWTSTNLLRVDLAEHAYRLDMAFHNTHTPGEMIERIDGDVTALSDFFSSFVMSILGSVLLLVGIVVLAVREDVLLGTALAAFVATALVVLGRLRRVAVPHTTSYRESSAGMFGFLEERLAGLDDIRALGGGPHVMRGWAASSRDVLRTSTGAEKVAASIWTTSSVLFAGGYVLTLALSARSYARGAITIGTVYLLFDYVTRLRAPLERIADELRDFQRAAAGIERVRDLAARTSRIHDGVVEPPDGPVPIAFDRVTFAYGDEETVLHDVSFELRRGEVLGVLGRTGSGKTTLTRLLTRQYDVTAGEVRIAGIDVRDIRLAAVRRAVGVVTQDVQLFQGTVRDNLTLFDASVPDARIRDVLSDLGLLDWLWSMPDGLDTAIASGGSGLSAGEGQLLAFARVFLRDPGVVLLDEASSRLDPATEAMLEHAVDRLLARRTGIIIAHRLKTVQRADTILILDGGRVVEFGPRTELAADPSSRFSRLLATGMGEVLT